MRHSCREESDSLCDNVYGIIPSHAILIKIGLLEFSIQLEEFLSSRLIMTHVFAQIRLIVSEIIIFFYVSKHRARWFFCECLTKGTFKEAD